MAGQIPPQLQKAISRRMGMKKPSMTAAPPKASSSKTNASKIATFKAPGFQKSNVLQKMQGADEETNDTAAPSGPQAFTQALKGNKSQQNSKAIIARRLQKQK